VTNAIARGVRDLSCSKWGVIYVPKQFRGLRRFFMKPILLITISIALWVVGFFIDTEKALNIWFLAVIISIVPVFVALIGSEKRYVLGAFAMLNTLIQSMLFFVLGGFISATSMQIIDADEEFYEKQFLRHTDITVPRGAEIICKQDTVEIMGIDGNHYDGHVRYRMPENDLSVIRQQLIEDSSFVFVPDSLVSWLKLDCFEDGHWKKDSSFHYQGNGNKNSYLFFSEDDSELFFIMLY
jgi:hypothetical protein